MQRIEMHPQAPSISECAPRCLFDSARSCMLEPPLAGVAVRCSAHAACPPPFTRIHASHRAARAAVPPVLLAAPSGLRKCVLPLPRARYARGAHSARGARGARGACGAREALKYSQCTMPATRYRDWRWRAPTRRRPPPGCRFTATASCCTIRTCSASEHADIRCGARDAWAVTR